MIQLPGIVWRRTSYILIVCRRRRTLDFFPCAAMKIGLAGFSGSGKSTVFQWLTGAKPDPAKIQLGQLGMAKIPDERLDWLSAQFKPKKTTPATIEFLDTPGLLSTERRDNPRRLAIMRDANGLLVVLNGFASGDLAAELK